MDDFNGYTIGLFINNSTLTPSPNRFSFTILDNIYSAFPKLKLNYPDDSGLALELGNFTQGVPLNIKFGIAGTKGLLDVNFKSSGRDTSSPMTGISGLNGNLEVAGLHEAYFDNRKPPFIALKEMTVSDAIKKIFSSEPNLKVENTKGKIESYANDDPYSFTREILLPQATNGLVRPYVFFRNLENELHFESINLLEQNAPSEKLYFGTVEEDNAYNAINTFLPYNENLDKTLPYFHCMDVVLESDLKIKEIIKSVATDAKNKIPVIVNTKFLKESRYYRQFNPKVDYEHLNIAFAADTMRPGFFVDKALAVISFHPNLVAGKTVDISVSIIDSDGKNELSETFSGKWLIEQSFHSWDGANKRGQTELILCRSSVIPRRDSIIMDRAFSD